MSKVPMSDYLHRMRSMLNLLDDVSSSVHDEGTRHDLYRKIAVDFNLAEDAFKNLE